jgi:hypothetical protein
MLTLLSVSYFFFQDELTTNLVGKHPCSFLGIQWMRRVGTRGSYVKRLGQGLCEGLGGLERSRSCGLAKEFGSIISYRSRFLRVRY